MQSTFENHIVKLDLQRFFLPLIIFASITIFMHILLHNYDKLEENSHDNHHYTSTLSVLPIATEIIPPQMVKNEEKLIKSPLEQIIVPIQNSNINLKVPNTNIIESKKIGNMTLISVKKSTNLLDILQSGSYREVSLIGKALVKSRQNLSLKRGDLLQIIENTQKKKENLKITINNKLSITVKKVNKNYQILPLKSAEKKQELNKKIRIITESITYKDLLNKNNKIPHNIKLDLLKLHSILRKIGTNPYKYQINYSGTRDGKLLFICIETSQGSKKIYKFKDKSGTVNFVEADGSLIADFKPSFQLFKLSYPLANPVLGSGFGIRKHPLLGYKKMHKGLDFPARRGTPIYAPADGIIIDITNSKGFGKNIRIRHNNVYTTLYGHLDAFGNKKIGHKIYKGEVIGFVGKTGLASGEHLHFELHENGRPINPMQMISAHNKIQSTKLLGKDLQAFKFYTNRIESEVTKL